MSLALRPSREIAVPFRIGPDGGIALVSNDYDAAVQHISTIIRTLIGERVMLPAYGSQAPAMLFEPNDITLTGLLTGDLAAALARWEPSVRIMNVFVSGSDISQGFLSITVAFTLAPREDVLTATVDVGGGLSDEQAF